MVLLVWPWLHQGLVISRVFVFFQLIPVFVNQDDLDLFRGFVRVLDLGALKLAVECRDVAHGASGAPVHCVGFVGGALIRDVAGFYSVAFFGDPLLPPV